MKMKDPKVVEKYNTILQEEFKKIRYIQELLSYIINSPTSFLQNKW